MVKKNYAKKHSSLPPSGSILNGTDRTAPTCRHLSAPRSETPPQPKFAVQRSGQHLTIPPAHSNQAVHTTPGNISSGTPSLTTARRIEQFSSQEETPNPFPDPKGKGPVTGDPRV